MICNFSVTVLFRLFIRSQGKQNGCIGYYGILGAFGGENFNKKKTAKFPAKRCKKLRPQNSKHV